MLRIVGKGCARRRQRGFSMIEFLVAAVIMGIVFAAIYQVMRGTTKNAKLVNTAANLAEDLTRFTLQLQNDMLKAGSDPTGAALNAYQLSEGCVSKIYFKYGINPDPTNSTCTGLLGNIQILSYTAYDSNNDGTVDVEEGLDFVSVSPALRPNGEDNIVYAFIDTNSDSINDAIARRNYGAVDSSADDTSATVLQNVVSFTIRYIGFDETGKYGGVITDYTRKDDIREVEFYVMTRAAAEEAGYNNLALPSSSPYYHYRTAETTLRTSLIVRKE